MCRLKFVHSVASIVGIHLASQMGEAPAESRIEKSLRGCHVVQGCMISEDEEMIRWLTGSVTV